MAGQMILKLVCATLVCMVVTAPYATAITCSSVIVSMSPCLGYLHIGGTVVPPACCAAAQGLNKSAKTTPDRQAACECLKTAVSSIPGLNMRLLGSLAPKCGVSLPFKISSSIDCKKVK